MKKVRLLLSPLYFTIIFCFMIIIPVSPMLFILGISKIIGKLFNGKKVDVYDRMVVFSFIIIPLFETIGFVESNKQSNFWWRT